MPFNSFTLSCTSPNIFIRYWTVASELESVGMRGGKALLEPPGEDMTTTSDSEKNSDSKEIYNFTISTVIALHCVGLRRVPVAGVVCLKLLVFRIAWLE